jgi:hypothetical protein
MPHPEAVIEEPGQTFTSHPIKLLVPEIVSEAAYRGQRFDTSGLMYNCDAKQ